MTQNPYQTPEANVGAPPAGDAPPLWNPDAAGAWSLLFTPVFGSILLLRNWQAIGDRARIRSARIWLVVSILIIFPAFFINYLGLIYLGIWYYAWQSKQSRYVKQRWGRDYPRKKWGMPLLIAFVSLFVVMVLLINVLAIPPYRV